MSRPVLLLLTHFLCFFACLHSVHGKDKVRLTDVKTLTLYNGRYTAGRRASSIPQLQCAGGSVGCNQLLPSVVQCYNKGHDGVDVQWECKAELDSRVKLGAIDVLCEGYDYPEDPYILKGSCGLEYHLDWKTGAGAGTSDYSWKPVKGRGFVFSDLLILAIVAVIVYALYKTCLTSPQYSTTSSDYPDGRPPYPEGYGGAFPSAPPPYYSGHSSQDSYGADCHGSSRNRGGGMGSGGFWTGAATGGILGYLFGQRNQGTNYGGSSTRHYGYTSGGNSGGGWGGSGGGSSAGTSTSTSFGGTRRR